KKMLWIKRIKHYRMMLAAMSTNRAVHQLISQRRALPAMFPLRPISRQAAFMEEARSIQNPRTKRLMIRRVRTELHSTALDLTAILNLKQIKHIQKARNRQII